MGYLNCRVGKGDRKGRFELNGERLSYWITTSALPSVQREEPVHVSSRRLRWQRCVLGGSVGAACVYAGLAGSVGGDMQGPGRASERWSPSGTLAPVSSLGDKGGDGDLHWSWFEHYDLEFCLTEGDSGGKGIRLQMRRGPGPGSAALCAPPPRSCLISISVPVFSLGP